jgi:hypothetical protein
VRIRQVVLAARDLEPVVEDIRAVLGLELGHRDPAVAAFGLQNAVFPVGEAFLEVVSPIQDGTAAGRFLEARGGDGGYMVMLQTDDFRSARRRIDELGVRVVLEVDLDDVVEAHLHPRDVPGAIWSVSEMRPAESWRWGGPHWRDFRRTDVVDGVIGVELEAADPRALAARLHEVFDLAPLANAAPGEAALGLESSEIRFRHRDALSRDGIVAYALHSVDAARALGAAEARGLPTRREGGERAIRIAGTWLRLG